MHRKIEVILQLRKLLESWSTNDKILEEIAIHNPWFIPSFSKLALENIVDMLEPNTIEKWVNSYDFGPTHPQNLGLVLAGNIPLVGFHDLLCAFMSPHYVYLKISTKDYFLTNLLLENWKALSPEFSKRLFIVDRLEKIDRIIATGSQNTYSYFKHYFDKYNHILRKNRTSIAFVPSLISDNDLNNLSSDIFSYFGFGCRNVSKLLIEKGMDLERLIDSWKPYCFLLEHSKYMNNYDYQRTLLLLNQTPHLASDFAILTENQSIFSPIASIHYEWVENIEEADSIVAHYPSEIQCYVSPVSVPYGSTQKPAITDYADGIDVMNFLK